MSWAVRISNSLSGDQKRAVGGGKEEVKKEEGRRLRKTEEGENRWEGKSVKSGEEREAEERENSRHSRDKAFIQWEFSLHPSSLLHSTHPFFWLSCFLFQSIFYSCRSRAMNPPQLSE